MGDTRIYPLFLYHFPPFCHVLVFLFVLTHTHRLFFFRRYNIYAYYIYIRVSLFFSSLFLRFFVLSNTLLLRVYIRHTHARTHRARTFSPFFSRGRLLYNRDWDERERRGKGKKRGERGRKRERERKKARAKLNHNKTFISLRTNEKKGKQSSHLSIYYTRTTTPNIWCDEREKCFYSFIFIPINTQL